LAHAVLQLQANVFSKKKENLFDITREQLLGKVILDKDRVNSNLACIERQIEKIFVNFEKNILNEGI